MTLKLDQHTDLRARIRRGDDAPTGAVVELIRASYPEVFKQISSTLVRGQETVVIEPGDNLLVSPDGCVMHRDKLIRRRISRRDDDSREHDSRDEKNSDASDVLDYVKEIDSPKNGVVSIDWDRPHYGQSAANEARSGRILITYYEPLSAASKEVTLKQLSDGAKREFLEAFATRCIPPVLNSFFGIRCFLVAQDTLLLTKPDLHGTERLQEMSRNPVRPDSEHMVTSYPDKHSEAFQFFSKLRDMAHACEERRAELSMDGLSKSLTLEVLAAIAIPQLHGTIANLLRMQYAFIQPNRVVGAPLLNAGAALQPAWDVAVQLRLLDGIARANHQYSSI